MEDVCLQTLFLLFKSGVQNDKQKNPLQNKRRLQTLSIDNAWSSKKILITPCVVYMDNA